MRHLIKDAQPVLRCQRPFGRRILPLAQVIDGEIVPMMDQAGDVPMPLGFGEAPVDQQQGLGQAAGRERNAGALGQHRGEDSGVAGQVPDRLLQHLIGDAQIPRQQKHAGDIGAHDRQLFRIVERARDFASAEEGIQSFSLIRGLHGRGAGIAQQHHGEVGPLQTFGLLGALEILQARGGVATLLVECIALPHED